MSEAVQAYPLQWPPGWRRCSARTSAKFYVGRDQSKRVDVYEGARRVYRELRMMGIAESRIVVSSDLRLRLDGMPYADQATSRLDPGVAVYWSDGEQHRCIAIDRYDRIADNLAAIAATLEALRAVERHGGGAILDRAFTGFTALPAPEQWFTILGVKATATRGEIEEAFRRLAMKHHPDRPGGDEREMARINDARARGLELAP
jgi:hypothetical protein